MAPDAIRKISQSVFYRLKKNFKTILAETDDTKTTNKYTRKAEKDLEPFEEKNFCISPNFLEKPCLPKTQKCQFFDKHPKFRIFKQKIESQL